MTKPLTKKPFFRYSVVGTASSVLDYVVLVALFHGLHAPLPVAATAGYIAGLLFNFVVNKKWAFKAKGGAKHTGKQALKYAVLLAVNLLVLNLALQWLDDYGIGPEYGKIIVTLGITVWNYFFYRRVIFKPKHPRRHQDGSDRSSAASAAGPEAGERAAGRHSD
ncbi:GtrA family protein [Candidatus Saccharibacteria bacterium]|nr:GtrA family protein [Candidatus Saccharibacteria bacterium]